MGSRIVGGSDGEGPGRQQQRNVLGTGGGQHGLDQRCLSVGRESHLLDASQSSGGFFHGVGAAIGPGERVASPLIVAEAQGSLRVGAFPQGFESVDALGECICHRGFFRLTRGILHGDGSNFDGPGVGHVGAGDHGFETHRGFGVGSQACQHFQRSLQATGPMPGDAGGPGAVVGISRAGEELDELGVGHLVRGEDAHGLVQSLKADGV